MSVPRLDSSTSMSAWVDCLKDLSHNLELLQARVLAIEQWLEQGEEEE